MCQLAIGYVGALSFIFSTFAAATLPAQQAGDTAGQLLSRPLQQGDAIVWYLSHSGWAVKTASHFLVFDYWEQHEPSSARALADGHIDPHEIADQPVTVFVSHGHGDHFDPVIYEWREAIPNLHYVFGWAATTDPEFTYLTTPRADAEIDGVRIRTVNHAFDRIPEVAFLVEVEGITLFHSGDHGSTRDDLNPIFQDNIDYLASLDLDVDLAFVSIFGRRGGGIVNRGDLYTIERLEPRFTFPMHRGGAEEAYEEWARAIADSGLEADVQFATRPGDVFIYRNGGVRRQR